MSDSPRCPRCGEPLRDAYGFTQEDLAWLRRMEFTTFDRAEAEGHQAWLQSFLARIAALLPPAP